MRWFAELPEEGVLAIHGDDAQSFLQAQLSCDLRELSPGSAMLGAWLTPRGRVFAVSRVLHADNGFALILPRVAVSGLSDALCKFRLRARVQIEDRSGATAVIGTSGIQPESIVADSAEPKLPFASLGERALLLCPGTRVEQTRMQLADVADERGAGEWLLASIRDGLPRVVTENREQFTAQMLNLDLLGGVSFAKGCFPGQEVVARAHHLGRSKRRMLRFWLPGDGAPGVGEPILLGDQAVGRVIAAARCPEGGCELLAVAKLADASVGAPLVTQTGVALERLVLPYAIPDPESP